MRVVAVSMFRDEADVAEHVVKHLLEQGVDEIIIADNMSTDGTREILEGLPVTLLQDKEVAYYQSEKITRLVHAYASEDCWVIPFDADEWWEADYDGRTLKEELTLIGEIADVAVAPVFDYIPQPTDDPNEPNPFKRIQWRESTPEVWPVVAFKYHPSAIVKQGAHDVVHPGVRINSLRIGHLQYRSYEHMCRKLRNGRAAYEATDLGQEEGAHWRAGGMLTDSELLIEWNRLIATPGLVWDPLV